MEAEGQGIDEAPPGGQEVAASDNTTTKKTKKRPFIFTQDLTPKEQEKIRKLLLKIFRVHPALPNGALSKEYSDVKRTLKGKIDAKAKKKAKPVKLAKKKREIPGDQSLPSSSFLSSQSGRSKIKEDDTSDSEVDSESSAKSENMLSSGSDNERFQKRKIRKVS